MQWVLQTALLAATALCWGTNATKIHQEGFCSIYDECGRNPEISNSLIIPIVPCVSNTPARRIEGFHLNKLMAVCPMLYVNDNDTRVCCSYKQLESIERSFALSKVILSRCPSCAENFANIYCQNTCSPNQSLFINVTRTFQSNSTGTPTEAALSYECYYKKAFAEESFNSCKNVRMPATGGYAIAAMCGKYGSEFCNSQRWLDFQGDTSNGLAPLDIDFKLIEGNTPTDGGIIPHYSKVWKCNESASIDGNPCSCQDCIETCPKISPPPDEAKPFTIGTKDGVLVICLIVFFLLTVIFLGFLFGRCIYRCKQAKEEKTKLPQVRKEDITCSEKLSMSTDKFLGEMFRKWGTLVASHPKTVIVISCVFVVALSFGLIFIELTTDPVELWSAPNSRARLEKDFHDANFGPFFRTNQLIITVANQSTHQYNSLFFGQQNFSSILSKDILLELLDLQTRLQKITVWSSKHNKSIALKDVCYAPLNPTNPSSTDCCVNSLMQYFQNNKTRFDLVVQQTISGQTGTVDWRDHFLYCVNSPLSFKDITDLELSCMADYGAPVFPFLAVGGYKVSFFTTGALTQMPAVKTFALNAALAVLLDFILQMSMFVALVSLDARREEDNRFDICCCIQSKKKKPKRKKKSFLYSFMKNVYAPVLLNSFTRIVVMVVFIFMFCAGIFFTMKVRVGLDQELSMPQDSYMLEYFSYLNKYFEVGVPTYFVTTGGYNFSTPEGINAICSSVGCNNNSMTQKIQYATGFPDKTYLAIPASSWVDDFIDWLNPTSVCCRQHLFGPDKGQFCPSTSSSPSCIRKCLKPTTGTVRPNVAEFNKYLPLFLGDLPNLNCPKGGLGAYDSAVRLAGDSNSTNNRHEIIATRFMAYHTPLKNSQEYTAALKVARELAANITRSARQVPGTDPNFEVFPYTITYVYYEQYLTIVDDGLFNLSLCLIPTFVVCCILLGMDIRSGFINLITIIMIVVDTVGVMTLWSIDYNAVSLINLVTAVGISVEFVSHLTRSFAISVKTTKVKRAKEATVTMGSAVFAGVAMTNLPGIIVLAFAKAQLIQIFFFRLNLTITLLGMLHGLVFLPVALSYFGPNINHAVLLERQEEEARLRRTTDSCQNGHGPRAGIGLENNGFESDTKGANGNVYHSEQTLT
ncbi:NPC1-like intracellular cholesterol transporter 1 [Lissotriton helveticus]